MITVAIWLAWLGVALLTAMDKPVPRDVQIMRLCGGVAWTGAALFAIIVVNA